MAQESYYDILGVSSYATADEIRRAFRKLAAKYHPDAGGDEKKFKAISEAYTTLSDEKKRKEYDQMLRFGIPNGGFGAQPHGSYTYTTSNVGDWNDIFTNIRNGDGAFGGFDFATMFGGGSAGRAGYQAPARGANLTCTLTIPMHEVFTGSTHTVNYTIPSTRERMTLKVTVPKGIEAGKKLRFRGKGEYGATKDQRGDLLVTINIEPHPLYRLEGSDVHMDVPISMYEAALGCTPTIMTPTGETLRLKVPAGTQAGKTFRFKDMGAPVFRNETAHGSLFVTVTIVVPSRLTKNEHEILERLRDNDTRDYRKDVLTYGRQWNASEG